jgi:hypothetical protein
MVKFLKVLLGIILFFVLCGGIFYFATNESKPDLKVETSAEADEMANRMLKAINVKAWDSTRVIQWSFKEMHDFVWDKEHNFVQVKRDSNTKLCSLSQTKSCISLKDHCITRVESQALTLIAFNILLAISSASALVSTFKSGFDSLVAK